MQNRLLSILITALSLNAVACGDDDEKKPAPAGPTGPTCEAPAVGQAAEPLSIAGKYKDGFDGSHDISSAQWKSGEGVFNIAAFDNTTRWVIARNDQTNKFNPCLWSRFDWALMIGKLHFCQTAYDAPSEADAKAKPAPDAAVPATGCSGFPWSPLTAE